MATEQAWFPGSEAEGRAMVPETFFTKAAAVLP